MTPATPRSSDVLLLANLGTPSAPTAPAVSRYLGEFLSDPRVVQLPRWFWLPLLRLVVLPLRSRRVAHSYAAVWMDGPVITDARVGLAAVGPNTTGIPAISEALRGQAPSDELFARAGAIAAESCSPTTDNRGTADYKRHLADELTRRTLRRAVERIEAGRAGDQAHDSEGKD